MQGALSSHFQRSPRFWISFARMLRDGIGVSDAQRWLAGWRAPANGKKQIFRFFAMFFAHVPRWAPDILQFANQRPDFAACQSRHKKP